MHVHGYIDAPAFFLPQVCYGVLTQSCARARFVWNVFSSTRRLRRRRRALSGCGASIIIGPTPLPPYPSLSRWTTKKNKYGIAGLFGALFSSAAKISLNNYRFRQQIGDHSSRVVVSANSHGGRKSKEREARRGSEARVEVEVRSSPNWSFESKP